MVLIKHSITEEILDVPKSFLNCIGLKYIFNNKIWFNDGKWKIINLFTDKSPLILDITQPIFNKNNDASAVSRDKFNASWRTVPTLIQNIEFHKIYLSASNDTFQIIDSSISYKKKTYDNSYTCNYLTTSQHITSHNNNGTIKLWTISPSTILPIPDYGIRISLCSEKNNITDWTNIDNISTTYKASWIGTNNNSFNHSHLLDIDDIKPHWEISNNTIIYYGGLAKILLEINAQLKIGKGITEFEVYLDDDVILPFGFSSAIFTMTISGLECRNSIMKLITSDKPIIIDNQFRNATINSDTLTTGDIKKILLQFNNGYISDYIKSDTTCVDSKIRITGGTINGYILKTSKFNYPNPNISTEEYIYLSMPWFWSPTTLRADSFNAYSISKNPNVLRPYNFLRIIEYWIFYGLLELNANQIELNNISVLCGSPRGISPVQLNGYVHETIPKGLDTYVHINNCQFCLHHYAQTDGLDVLSDNVRYNSVYFQVADDTFKLNSKNITGNDITIVSGAAGGAINFHSYGTNKYDISTYIENIYIHLYSKINNNNNYYTPDCAKKYLNSPNYCYSDCGTCKIWPGPAIIFAPVYPIKQTASTITVSGVYLNNYNEYNINRSTNKAEPEMFMVGGWMDQLPINNTNLANNQTFNWNVNYVYYNTTLKEPSDNLPVFLILKNIGEKNIGGDNSNSITLKGIYNPSSQLEYIVNTNELNIPTSGGNIKNQKWNINYKDKDKATAQIQLNGSNKCLDIPGNYNIDTGYPSGYRLWIWDCSYAYTWNVSEQQDTKSFYYINFAHQSGPLYLNFDTSNIAVLSSVETSFIYNNNNQLKLSNNYCLDNLGGDISNANFVGQWECAP